MVVVDRADDFLGVPRHAHLAPGIDGVQQAQQPAAAPVVETLIRAGEQSAGPVERVVLAAPVAEGLVLDPARTSSRRWLASLTRWNASATWVAEGSTVSKVVDGQDGHVGRADEARADVRSVVSTGAPGGRLA